nr:cobyrinate a,c-diamide synthase [Gammaproteobacteria bacterium]
MSETRRCPALLISAPASGQGKTTVTAGLAWLHRQCGRRIRVFKTGPDFLDPMVLERASGNPVYQLDLWMGGEAHCRQLLYHAAGGADLILIEGVMGLFDGERSSADLAELLGVPVVAVINATAMAETFGAIAWGLAAYRPSLTLAGVVANQVAGPGHATLIANGTPPNIALLAALPQDAALRLPSRHLGLVQAAELADLDRRLDHTAKLLGDTALAALPEPTTFSAANVPAPFPGLTGTRIAVARDTAFSFLYPANLDLLRAMGATLTFFSPLADAALPQADAVYLPGGYPELHLAPLARNAPMKRALRAHHQQGKPLVAECGGMLYLVESLTDVDGQRAEMVGLLPGHAVTEKRLTGLGMHRAAFPEGAMRGHTFHYSRLSTPLEPYAWSEGMKPGRRGEPLYRLDRLHASYLHLYFPSNPQAVARLFAP